MYLLYFKVKHKHKHIIMFIVLNNISYYKAIPNCNNNCNHNCIKLYILIIYKTGFQGKSFFFIQTIFNLYLLTHILNNIKQYVKHTMRESIQRWNLLIITVNFKI